MKSKTITQFWCFALLNIPFTLCHPAFPLLTEPLSRSLVINMVLFVVPGLPLTALLTIWKPAIRLRLLFVVVGSLCIFMAVIVAFFLARIPMSAGGVWNTTWVVTNLLILLNIVLGEKSALAISQPNRIQAVGALLFVVAYITFYIGAAHIVPITGDNDDEMQFTVHGLLTSLEPRAFTPRDTSHYFAHPPLLHICVAASFLYYDHWEDMAAYDQGPGPQNVSPRAEFSKYAERFTQKPHRIETRTPNIFFGAVTVACLGMWIAASAAGVFLALLAALAYMLTPEVFVRSSYGGYFAIGNLILMGMVLAEEERSQVPKQAWFACILVGALAAVADHKLVVVVTSLALWETLRSRERLMVRASLALRHPTVIGFAVGTALFWVYGLTISPRSFWIDHVRYHFVDRIIHKPTPWQVAGHYPGLDVLWLEFMRDTGWLLLPLAIASFVILWRGQGGATSVQTTGGECRTTTGFWALWVMISATAFSIVDWRQTKHLANMTLPLFLAPARAGTWARLVYFVTAMVFVLLIALNLKTIMELSVDFEVLKKLPEW